MYRKIFINDCAHRYWIQEICVSPVIYSLCKTITIKACGKPSGIIPILASYQVYVETFVINRRRNTIDQSLKMCSVS